jgi:hypothetical protein
MISNKLNDFSLLKRLLTMRATSRATQTCHVTISTALSPKTSHRKLWEDILPVQITSSITLRREASVPANNVCRGSMLTSGRFNSRCNSYGQAADWRRRSSLRATVGAQKWLSRPITNFASPVDTTSSSGVPLVIIKLLALCNFRLQW